MLILLLLARAGAAWGVPSPAESRALAAAESSYQLGLWERAEKQFASFAEKYSKSEDRAQAVLRQAQARVQQGKFLAATDLLSARQRDAGALAGEYQFWLGESYFRSTNFLAAADAYARLVKGFTNSPHVLEASYDEALARSKLNDWPGVDDLLRQSDGAFQKFAAGNPTNEFVVRGILLLGEAQLAQNDPRAAEETLRPLAEQKLNAELDWRRQYLLCRIQLAADRPADALQATTNLEALAKAAGKPELQAETVMLKGGILERAKRFDDAVAVYETNLAEDQPIERRRQAVMKIVELLLARNKASAAAQRLEKFFGQYGKDKAADVALLTVGELHLKEHLASPTTNRIELTATNSAAVFPAFTNHLQQAFAQFDWIVKTFPRSPVLGKALLNRGWCLWLADQMPESRAAFQLAAEKSPQPYEQAVARYKWADCQMRLGDFAGALTNYNFVLDNFATVAAAREELFEPALYQVVRASVEKGDQTAATNALARILAAYPESFLCERGMLLAGEKLNRLGNPATARNILTSALQRFPKSSLAPETRLAVARTFEQEKNWPAALAEYDRWLTNYPGQEAQPRVEFSRAWVAWQGGQGAVALAAFARFVTQYPTNDLAPLAQNWVADYYLQQGDFKNAEANYQLLFQKWPPSVLTWSARLMAGRAAMARLGYAEAVGYFTKLINDKDCPPDLVAQAFFEYGDATMRMESTETNKPLANFEEAIRIFKKIPQLYPTNDLVPPAWGRIGDCYLQLAVADAKLYAAATSAYQQVVDAPRANIVARSQAEVGLSVVLEKLAADKTGAEQTALLKQAQDHYLNVVLGANLRETESADPFWVKKAGLEAARVAEVLENWPQAVNLYRRLEELLPPLKESLEKKIAKAQQHATQPTTQP